MPDPYSIKHSDELETLEGSGGATWRLARRGLGLAAFGINLVEIPAGGSIVEHDEQGSGQVEIYAVLEGEGVFVVDGTEHPAPAGTWGRFSPAVKRNVLNRSGEPLTALLIGVPEQTGYEPPSWA